MNQTIVLVAFDCIMLVLVVLAWILLLQQRRWSKQDRERVLAARRALLDGEE